LSRLGREGDEAALLQAVRRESSEGFRKSKV